MAYKDDQDRFFQEQLELREQRVLAQLHTKSPLASPEEIREVFRVLITEYMTEHDLRHDAAKELALTFFERTIDLDVFDERFNVKAD